MYLFQVVGPCLESLDFINKLSNISHISKYILIYLHLFNFPLNLCRDEVFGPVAPLVPFKTEEDAINMANDTNAGT